MKNNVNNLKDRFLLYWSDVLLVKKKFDLYYIHNVLHKMKLLLILKTQLMH